MDGWWNSPAGNTWSGAEAMFKKVSDIENIVVGTSKGGELPILIKQLGSVTLGPDIRRGIAELDGKGEVVGGIVIMRFGENALKVIERVRTKLEEIEALAFRPALKIVTTYDRGPI